MTTAKPLDRHDEVSVAVDAHPEAVFALADDHAWLAGHMSASSWMMAGSAMTTSMDDKHGRAIGAHITMTGTVLGITLELDEVVTERVPPWAKTWETVGQPRLLVIGGYRMGFRIRRDDPRSHVTMWIDYDLPQRQRWLGVLFGQVYARWCVRQMTGGMQRHFRRAEGA